MVTLKEKKKLNETGGDFPARLHNTKQFSLTLKEKLETLPRASGCYLFKDSKKKIIYVGKAKDLRSRVRSYFTNRDDGRQLFHRLTNAIRDVEVIIVNNEIEALILESNLIKQFQPRYNIDLKDDRNYPYLRITNEPFPQVFLSRNPKQDGAKYLGPFMEVKILRSFIRELKKILKIRTCELNITTESIQKRKHKLCLQYHIHLCEGPCVGYLKENEYQQNIQIVIDILNGKTNTIEEQWKSKMSILSGQNRFEEAALIRDQLRTIQHISNRQRVLSVEPYDRDALAIFREDDESCIVILRIRNGRMVGRLHYYQDRIHSGIHEDDVLSQFVIQHYLNADLPDEIIVNSKRKNWDLEARALYRIRDKKIKITAPTIGDKLGQCKIALSNAKLLHNERQLAKIKRDFISPTLQSLQNSLNLPTLPKRIDCFDVSHLSGTNTVATVVVFLNGKPQRSEYRKYIMKRTQGIDDFSSLKEVVERRYKRLIAEKKPYPDLIVIDGGKGQVNQSFLSLSMLGLSHLSIIGLAKRLEEIYLPNESDPILLSKTSSALRLLQQIRDETHRFTVTFQKARRNHNSFQSVLDGIHGIGPKRQGKILTNFPELNSFLTADTEFLSSLLKMSTESVERVKIDVTKLLSIRST